MTKTNVYLSFGGNIGNTQNVFKEVLRHLASSSEISSLRLSRLYLTRPQDVPPQRDYVNAACHLKTTLSVQELAAALQSIEQQLGKRSKPKDTPRVIDIDILFFGQEYHMTADLQIPHLRWRSRPFVLFPLLDLVSHLAIPIRTGVIEVADIAAILEGLPHSARQQVRPVPCCAELAVFQQDEDENEACASQRLLYR